MRKGLISTIATAFVLALSAVPASAQVQLVPFGGQSFPAPRYVASPPGDTSRVFVVGSGGTIKLVLNGTTQPGNFLDISTDVCNNSDVPSCGGESGMFSLAFAPDYASSGLFYVFYTRDVPTVQHELVIREFQRSTGDPNDANEASGRDVMVIPHPTAPNHNGGQLQFGPDGLLYISVGDGGTTPVNGQSLTTRLGKLLRIDPTGTVPGQYTIPPDNPFADGPAGEADEIYSYGLRNPYRSSFDRLTGALTIGDVGEGSREEVDFVANRDGSGANFGWRCYEGMLVHATTAECSPLPANHTPPVLEYPHTGTAAVSGGYVVRDAALPSLLGRYLYADTYNSLGGEIYSAQLSSGGATGNASTGLTAAGVVSFGEDACGHIYVVEAGGAVRRIEPTTPGFPCQPPHPTTTGISCVPSSLVLGAGGATCTATVTDAATSPTTPTTPTGSVSFASTGTGGFSPTGCTLAALGGNQASCSVTYTASAVGTGNHHISGSYAGDATHSARENSTGVAVLAAQTPPIGIGTATPGPSFDLSAAIKRCKKTFEKGKKKRRTRCIKKARRRAET